MTDLTDNASRNRFEMQTDGETSFVTYRRENGRLFLLHAEVPRALEGRGVGSKLVRAVLDHARSEGVSVVPVCSFVAATIRRHPEYQDLVA